MKICKYIGLNLYVLRPPESEKVVFTKVSVSRSVVGRILDNSRQNYQIKLSVGTLYRSGKSKDKFGNQPYPTKIVETTIFCVLVRNFLKKSKILILVFDSAYKSLQIIYITFFD